MSRELEIIGPDARYERNIDAGYVDDVRQRRIVEIFTDLHRNLTLRYSSPSLLSRVKHGLGLGARDPIRGLYLWGGPGRGKTCLLYTSPSPRAVEESGFAGAW